LDSDTVQVALYDDRLEVKVPKNASKVCSECVQNAQEVRLNEQEQKTIEYINLPLIAFAHNI
jgi:Mg-chelatase subunit ChlI